MTAIQQRWEMEFRGRVQGVGFRHTAARIAERYHVAGWVRNEPDGSVRCVAEGPPEELERFLTALEDAMAGHIREKVVQSSPVTREFKEFEIRR